MKLRNKQKSCLSAWHRLKVLKIQNVNEGIRVQAIPYMVCIIKAILNLYRFQALLPSETMPYIIHYNTCISDSKYNFC